MKILLFCLSFICSLAFANASDDLTTYFNYLEQYPKALLPVGNAEQGEIEIVLDEQKIFDIQEKMGRKVGIVAEDKYWLWINDAVKFPNGKYGIYGRLLWRQSLTGPTGVAVMPVLPDGRIVLNRNYRHATRSWEYELPRGGVNVNETIEDAAHREVKEETGMVIDKLQFLGQIVTDSGISNSCGSVFLARVIAQEDAQPEDSEAIAAIEAFSIDELREGFVNGFLSVEVDGEIRKISLRDSFLTFALFQAEIRALFPLDSNQ